MDLGEMGDGGGLGGVEEGETVVRMHRKREDSIFS